MKPFNINRKSWHYNLNKNFFNEDEHWMQSRWEPMHNNFCSYWRDTMFRMIFAVLLAAIGLSIVGTLSYMVYLDPLTALAFVVGVFIVGGFLVGLAFISHLIEDRKRKKSNEEPSQSLFAQKYRANKEKICPMVEYK